MAQTDISGNNSVSRLHNSADIEGVVIRQKDQYKITAMRQTSYKFQVIKNMIYESIEKIKDS